MSTYEIFVSLAKVGLKVTLQVTFSAAVLALVLGVISGLARMSKHKMVRFISSVYIEIFRGTSLLVQLFWMYFVLPMIGIRLSALTAGILAIGLNFGAYCSEIVRSAIQAVPSGQTEACIALNMTKTQRMRRVIIPQAFVMMIPNLGNQLIELLKSTSLVSMITLTDLTYQANILNATTFETTKVYSMLLILYFIIGLPLSKGMKLLEQKVSEGRV
ncbi:ectoine/hydroxyectoine ABC transporter permease subunit EhuC [Faecalicatena contorta]|uniref:Amino acid ABC transporter membrane protein 1, PAAT family n=1 Tax=Faecalicatena contorta TaxID=39482 RepID=A0A315ZZG5_9FIRM|nr:ectoine/hydroxyectoine ABC transporter permease subunit EhuC [Faecalicatena contorta]PWJ50723.1 amino acid ABC transporter membrane protein 1 (PAAT family) [Faecalicatena contorta]SUQ13291.1 amino acid ABC transporter membrane protein 1, PAAT family [Faecalicatena contorta]